MKNVFSLISTLALVCLVSFNLSAQESFTEWNGIDKITIKENIQVSNYHTLFLVPIDEDPSIVKFEDNDKKDVDKVFEQVAAFRSIILKEIKGSYKKLDVKIVDEIPASLTDEDLMLKIKYTEFNLGSAALRGWVGGGNAGVSIDATIATADCPDAIAISQRHKSGLLSANAYHKVLKEQQVKFAKDFVVVFKELDK